jgi:phosphoglycolate phosphatase-like HAD superfamily hydrolase
MKIDRSTTALILLATVTILGGCFAPPPAVNREPTLPSWNAGGSRDAIIAFVDRVTDPRSPDFVPESERIAVFDNDGTLWSEQPMYAQLAFALDRVRAMAPDHPEWKTTPPFQFVLENDLRSLAATGEHGLVELVLATHAGMSTDDFDAIVEAWLDDARHPQTGRPYHEMIYQPMVELLDYLRFHGFETWIVSGGGIDFMRIFAEETYGIPPQQVIGSYGDLEYEVGPDGPRLIRTPGIAFIDDKGEKPVGIHRAIGRRPIAAFGNSDGDFQMLEWTTAGEGPRLGVYVHHTDAEREVAYDRASSFGRLDRGLDEAEDRGWVVIDMKTDWRTVFPAGG